MSVVIDRKISESYTRQLRSGYLKMVLIWE